MQEQRGTRAVETAAHEAGLETLNLPHNSSA
jgi:hypothetical protein